MCPGSVPGEEPLDVAGRAHQEDRVLGLEDVVIRMGLCGKQLAGLAFAAGAGLDRPLAEQQRHQLLGQQPGREPRRGQSVDASTGRSRPLTHGAIPMNLFGSVFGLIIFVLDIWAIASIINSGATGKSKVIWVLVVAILPVAGLIAWWIAGPKANYGGRR